MIKNCLIHLLITLSLSQAQIRMARSCPNQNTFPQIKPNITFETTLQKRPNGVRAQILNTVRGWVSSLDGEITSYSSKIDKSDGSTPRCKVSYFFFQQQINHVTRIHSDSSSYVPGIIMQTIDPTNFAKGIIPVYIPNQKRNPINITISNGFNAELLNIPNRITYNQKITQLVIKNADLFNNAPIEIYIAQPQGIEKLLRQLGLSSRIYEQIGIGSSNSAQISNIEKIVITVSQKFFSAALNFTTDSKGVSPSIPETIFSQHYTLQDFFQNQIWGPRNVPQIISQSNYGRLLLLSMDSNSRSIKLKEKLQSCFTNGAANMNCFETAMNQIRQNPTLRYYVAGVDPSSVTQAFNSQIYKETVSWKKIFFTINDKNADLIRPLSARMLNLLGKKFVQTQNRYFSTTVCSKNAPIQFKIESIAGNLSAKIKKHGELKFGSNIFATNKAGNFLINSEQQPFEIMFILSGIQHKIRSWYFLKGRAYQRQLKINIVIDNQVKFTKQTGNKRAKDREQTFIVRIDPIRGTVS